jgi:hypothetical protein
MINSIILAAVDTDSAAYQSGYVVGQILLPVIIIGIIITIVLKVRKNKAQSKSITQDKTTELPPRKE